MIEQYSSEWFAARAGKVTASRVSDVVAKTKTGWGASRANYMAQLITERLTGEPGESYTNAAMQWGIDTEPQAIRAYEFYRGNTVEPIGFIEHPEIAMAGASPDGGINDGLVECKCPNSATHLDTLLDGKIPSKYATQMQWQMACSGRLWCDFISFDPRMPERHALFVKRLMRDREEIIRLERAVATFIREMDAKIAELEGRSNIKDALRESVALEG
ncbi:MAG: lambda exonuclease family protein [Gammaproteobacteria bacterium]